MCFDKYRYWLNHTPINIYIHILRKYLKLPNQFTQEAIIFLKKYFSCLVIFYSIATDQWNHMVWALLGLNSVTQCYVQQTYHLTYYFKGCTIYKMCAKRNQSKPCFVSVYEELHDESTPEANSASSGSHALCPLWTKSSTQIGSLSPWISSNEMYLLLPNKHFRQCFAFKDIMI